MSSSLSIVHVLFSTLVVPVPSVSGKRQKTCNAFSLAAAAAAVCLLVYLLLVLQATASAPAVCRPRFSFVGGGMMAGVDQQTGVSRWKLVKAEEEVRSDAVTSGMRVCSQKPCHDVRCWHGGWFVKKRQYLVLLLLPMTI